MQGFEVNWPRNFKKIYLSVVIHTSIQSYTSLERAKNALLEKKKYFGLNKFVDTKRVFLGYKRV